MASCDLKCSRRNTEMDCRKSPTRQQTNAPKFIKRKTCCIYTLSLLAKITKRSLKMTLLQSISINFALECIRNIEHSYILKNSSFSLASAEASLYRREAGERKKNARGGQWEGEREEARFFPLPIVPRALSIFPLLLFLLGYPAEASAEERGSFSLAKALNFVFKA